MAPHGAYSLYDLPLLDEFPNKISFLETAGTIPPLLRVPSFPPPPDQLVRSGRFPRICGTSSDEFLLHSRPIRPNENLEVT